MIVTLTSLEFKVAIKNTQLLTVQRGKHKLNTDETVGGNLLMSIQLAGLNQLAQNRTIERVAYCLKRI